MLTKGKANDLLYIHINHWGGEGTIFIWLQYVYRYTYLILLILRPLVCKVHFVSNELF